MDPDTTNTPVIITYGNLDTHGTMAVMVVPDLEAAKKAALEFIQVIPDDLDTYQEMITAWTGEGPLAFTHQDDDCFFFSAVSSPVGTYGALVTDPSAFARYVSDNRHDF